MRCMVPFLRVPVSGQLIELSYMHAHGWHTNENPEPLPSLAARQSLAAPRKT